MKVGKFRIGEGVAIRDQAFFLRRLNPLLEQFGLSIIDDIDLTLYINKNPYENPRPELNQTIQHYSPTNNHIFIRVMHPEDFPKEYDYNLYLRAAPFYVFYHELGHWFTHNFIGEEKITNPRWLDLISLSEGNITPDFNRVETGGYSRIPADEQQAWYFHDLVIGRKKNERYKQYVLKLIKEGRKVT
jgi:hypothetical protein